MINLIPDSNRINNRYALRNVRLTHYLIVSAITMFIIIVITSLSILNMLRVQNNLQDEIDSQNQKLITYKPLEAEGEKLATQISTINNLLNRQVTFSTLLPDIAKIMPQGAILKELDFTTSDILPTTSGSSNTLKSNASSKKPFVIQAAVTDRAVAATLLENIKATKSLFTDADLVDVTQTNTGSTSSSSVFSRYPYQVTINAYLKKLNPKALNTTSGKQQ